MREHDSDVLWDWGMYSKEEAFYDINLKNFEDNKTFARTNRTMTTGLVDATLQGSTNNEQERHEDFGINSNPKKRKPNQDATTSRASVLGSSNIVSNEIK